MEPLSVRPLRIFYSLALFAGITFLLWRMVPVNATTASFAYLLFVLVIASTWGFIEASILSVAAMLAINFFFYPPVGTFNIADSQNWIALFSFLATSLIASRLSTEAKQRALDAIERQQEIERLYTFSRSLLLTDASEPFATQLVRKLADIFQLSAASLYDRRTDSFHRAGPSELEDMDEKLRDTALHGTSLSDRQTGCVLTAVRLGAEPIASLAIQPARMPDSVLQGIANLVAIGLERARAQDLAHQIEAARQSEQLRTTLIDAMAHEFKTPLTSIKAATTLVLDNPDHLPGNWMELLKLADEEAEHLRELIDDTVAMARLDTDHIEINPETSDIVEIIGKVIDSMRSELGGRPIHVSHDEQTPACAFDQRLLKLAIKQLINNALKYSPTGTPIEIRIFAGAATMNVEVTDHGNGISAQDLDRIFERFYRSPSVRKQIPGSGLGLSIARSIMRAHRGDLTVSSSPGETTFRLILPAE
jgi:two-component system, OmpR family, sensor histidine kinase KdpD